MEIIPVEREEEAHYLSRRYGIGNVVYDIGGSLTKLQSSLEAGTRNQGGCRELRQSERECELKWGIKIRLCKLVPLEKAS